MIWNESRECISRDERMYLQGERLVKLVKHMYYEAGYYRIKMQQLGLEPGDIRGLEDLEKLPFTTKEDLEKAYPFGMFVVPQSEIVRYHTSRDKTGREIIIGYTRNDIDMWSECVARTISMAGLDRNDVIQVAYNYNLFTDGLGAHYGAEKVGAAVVPSSICNMSRLIAIMKDLGVTGIMSTPSYLLRIVQTIKDQGLTGQLKLKTAICGGEPWSENRRRQIQTTFGIKAYDMYGLSELAGFGVAGECECQNGLHVQEDYFLTEVLDVNSHKAVSDGQKGELVFTTLHKEGMPLIRYRTMDVTSINREKCKCGRTTARIERFHKEIENILMIRGKKVLRAQIVTALLKLEDIKAAYMVFVRKEHNLDVVDVLIVPDGRWNMPALAEEESVRFRVANAVQNEIGMTPKVMIADKGIQLHDEGRKVTVIDKRN